MVERRGCLTWISRVQGLILRLLISLLEGNRYGFCVFMEMRNRTSLCSLHPSMSLLLVKVLSFFFLDFYPILLFFLTYCFILPCIINH